MPETQISSEAVLNPDRFSLLPRVCEIVEFVIHLVIVSDDLRHLFNDPARDSPCRCLIARFDRASRCWHRSLAGCLHLSTLQLKSHTFLHFTKGDNARAPAGVRTSHTLDPAYAAGYALLGLIYWFGWAAASLRPPRCSPRSQFCVRLFVPGGTGRGSSNAGRVPAVRDLYENCFDECAVRVAEEFFGRSWGAPRTGDAAIASASRAKDSSRSSATDRATNRLRFWARGDK